MSMRLSHTVDASILNQRGNNLNHCHAVGNDFLILWVQGEHHEASKIAFNIVLHAGA